MRHFWVRISAGTRRPSTPGLVPPQKWLFIVECGWRHLGPLRCCTFPLPPPISRSSSSCPSSCSSAPACWSGPSHTPSARKAQPRPRSQASLSNAGNNPWLPVISTSPASVRHSHLCTRRPHFHLFRGAVHPNCRHYTPSVRVQRHVTGAAPRNGCSASGSSPAHQSGSS